jgi:hypothetical protein
MERRRGENKTGRRVSKLGAGNATSWDEEVFFPASFHMAHKGCVLRGRKGERRKDDKARAEMPKDKREGRGEGQAALRWCHKNAYDQGTVSSQ